MQSAECNYPYYAFSLKKEESRVIYPTEMPAQVFDFCIE